MIEAILFDFDGVLFHSQHLHFLSTNIALKELGLLMDSDLYNAKYVGTTDRYAFEKLLRDNGHEVTPEKITNLIEKKMLAYHEVIEGQVQLDAMDGALQFLQHISKKIDKFAVCSNANRQEFDFVFPKLERGLLAPFFQFTITSNDVSQAKPSPEGYLQAAKRFGVNPENCLVIEDSKTGITAGKRAGMNVVGLTTSYAKEELEEVEPIFIADTYADIEKWLLLK